MRVVSTATGPADLLVNCTSVGLADPAATFKELPVRADAAHGDLVLADPFVLGERDFAIG